MDRDPETGLPIGISFLLDNVGKEPATQTRTRGLPDVWYSPPLDSSDDTWMSLPFWDEAKKKDVCPHMNKNPWGDTIYPGVQAPRTRFAINPQEIDAVTAGDRFFYVVVCNAYNTIGKKALTSFCLFLKPIASEAPDKWSIVPRPS
jgi:hypothetical protein